MSLMLQVFGAFVIWMDSAFEWVEYTAQNAKIAVDKVEVPKEVAETLQVVGMLLWIMGFGVCTTFLASMHTYFYFMAGEALLGRCYIVPHGKTTWTYQLDIPSKE